MNRPRNVLIPSDMKALGQRIEQWRKTRQNRDPMPAELWEAAVALAGRYGVYPTAQGLTVDFGGLKRRVEKAALSSSPEIQACSIAPTLTPGTAPSETFQFVEIDTSQVMEVSRLPKISVELSTPDGAKMTLRMEGGTGVDAIGLAGTFWKRGS